MLRERLGPLLQQHGMNVQDVSGERSDGVRELVLHLRCRNHLQAPDVLESVVAVEGARSAPWSMLSDQPRSSARDRAGP